MIRLKSLLVEKDIKESNTIRVLAVGDDFSKPRYSFINSLFRVKQISGKKIIKPGANSETITSIVNDNIKDGYDILIVFCSGRNDIDTTMLNLIQNFKLITKYANDSDVKSILCTIPSFDYVKDDKKQLNNKFFENIDIVNDWIRTQSSTDDIIDINFLTNKRSFFLKDGSILNDEGNKQIFKKLKDIITTIKIAQLNSATDFIVVSGKRYDIDTIQQELNKKGIAVSKQEIKNGDVDTEIKQVVKDIKSIDTDSSTDSSIEVKIGSERKGTAIQIIKYLIDNGLSPAGAAAVTGNLYIESAGTFSTTIQGDRGTSIGLAQWHNARWTGKNGLVNWCTTNGKDPYSIEGQLDFLLWELSASSYSNLYSELKTTNNAGESAKLFAKKFERPSEKYAQYDKRSKYAEEFLETYNNSVENEDSESEDSESELDGGSGVSSNWNNLTNILLSTAVAAVATKYGLSQGDVDSAKVTSGGTNGDWGGSVYRALEIANVANKFAGKNIISSQKRSRKQTANGSVSDHWEGNIDAYAVDLATYGKDGDELLAHIMKYLGHPEYTGGKWFEINKDGYRYQIGWRVPDHYDHIHVGVKKL